MAKTLGKFLPLILLMPACGGDDTTSVYSSGTNSGVTVGADSTTDASGDGDAGDGDGDGDGNGDGDDGPGGPRLDVFGGDEEGRTTAGDTAGGDGCKKVDFLFVIDNSGSMLDKQTNLVASFPSFIQSISTTLDAAQDYHIMVVDTDAWVHEACPLFCAFPVPLPGLCVGYQCGVTQPEECEDILGAGVTHPKGANASNVDCNFGSGKRFMTDQEPNLVGKFHCAARVGTGATSDPEKPMEAMVNAVSGLGAAGACNEGFLRDDAILVVTFITDEDDAANNGSSGTVQTWRQGLIDAKNGDASSVVVLGLFGDGDQPAPLCGSLDSGGAEVAPRLRQFLDSWGPNGVFGSICAPDYKPFFQSAVDIIDTTCDTFVPPG